MCWPGQRTTKGRRRQRYLRRHYTRASKRSHRPIAFVGNPGRYLKDIDIRLYHAPVSIDVGVQPLIASGVLQGLGWTGRHVEENGEDAPALPRQAESAGASCPGPAPGNCSFELRIWSCAYVVQPSVH